MLSACGGGSSSNSNGGKTGTGNTTLTKPDFQQWSSLYIDEYSDSDLNYEIEQLTFDQGNIYIKVDETTGWDESETFYLTENGLYDHGSTHATYGKLQGTITANATTWKQVPYSPINSTGLSSTLTFKVFDISGKNIAQVLSPEHYVNLKYNLLDTYPMGEKGKIFIEYFLIQYSLPDLLVFNFKLLITHKNILSYINIHLKIMYKII